MVSYTFQAKTKSGKMVRGTVNATSEAEARAKIRAQGMAPLKLALASASGMAREQKRITSKGVKAKELQVFTRQFAVLVSAGVPIVQSISAMIGGGRSPTMNAALTAILNDLENGRRLNEAMAKYPNIFNNMYVNLVRAGEDGGVLDTILNRLATYIEKTVKLRGRIKGALTYPAVIIVVAIIVIAGILTFVIPSFMEMFKQSGQELPFLTQMVVNLSDSVRNSWYLYLGTLIGIPYLLISYYQTTAGRQNVDEWILKVPVMGELVRKGAIARFSRTLATMLKAGVRVVEALEISAATAQNYPIERTVLEARDAISRGKMVSDPLKQSKHIPAMVSQMIFIGEQTGNMDAMLEKVADFYEDEVEATADAMTSLIEPLMMVVLGGIIAVLVLAMYLPIFSLAGTMGG